MKENIMKVTLEEITPEKIIEIENYLLDQRISNYTRSSLKQLGEYKQMIKTHCENVEAKAKMRAMEAVAMGFSAKEVGELLGFSTAIVSKWSKVSK